MFILPFKYFCVCLPYSNTLLEFLKIFLPEVIIFMGILLYFLCFLFSWGRNIVNNFMIFGIILFGILLSLLFASTQFNYQHLLISFYYTWFIKFFLLISIMGFTYVHYCQISFAWFKNNKFELDLGSKYFELNLFLLVSLLASYFLVSSNDFIILYVNIEILNICFTLICYLIYERMTIEATLKYFFINIFFSYFILFGICFIYFSFYTFNFLHVLQILLDFNTYRSVFYKLHMEEIVESSSIFTNKVFMEIIAVYFNRKLNWLLIGLFFIFFGLLGKIGLFPGFFWVLDVYGNISVLSNIILSIFPKIIYLSLICHLGYCFEIYSSEYSSQIYLLFFYSSGVLTILYAIIFTLNQWRIKRFLAGSSLVNLSFLIFLIGSYITYIDQSVLSIIFFFLSVYLVNLFIFFYIYILFIQPTNIKLNYYFEDLREFVQIKINHKLLAIILTLTILSLIGVPPLIGFYSKLTIFYFLTLQQNIILILFIIIANIISCFYYLRAIRFILFATIKNFGLFLVTYGINLYISVGFIFIFLFSFLFIADLIIFYLP